MGKLTTTNKSIPAAGFRRFGVLFLGLVLGSPVTGQSAANFEAKTITPVSKAGEEKVAKTVPAETGPVSAAPSRNMGPAELEPYLQSVSAVFLIRGRVRDPFGQNQDPDAKPVIKASTPLAVRRAAPAQVTPFSDIVRLLVVTTIMPGEKRFLVGTRSFKQGDVIPLSYRSKQIRAMVTGVTSRQISFRNLDTGELAERKLDMLPPGMVPGTNGITAPGMVADRPNAPIDLEAVDPATSISTN